MKNLSFTAFALWGLLCAASCIEEDLDACPPTGGGIAVTLRAEKFLTRPPYAPTDMEEDFAGRIRSLDYLLYADGRLIEQGRADLRPARGDSYVFRHDTLPFGSYRLTFVANAEPRMMVGETSAPENYYIVYQGEAGGDDHFRADVPFDVTCPYRNEFETVLQRVHGVTRFCFENLPEEISAIEVQLDNVGARTPLSGSPDAPRAVSKRLSVGELSGSGCFTLGTFATPPGLRSSWRLRLYTLDDAVPLYDRTVTDTLRIESNFLTELTARFKEGDFLGDIEFTVRVDTSWDGSNDGGGGAVH